MAKSGSKKAARKGASGKKPIAKPVPRRRGGRSFVKTVTARAKPSMARRRTDLGAPADGYFAGVSPASLNRAAKALRAIVRGAAPDATEAIKWGMPVYEHHGMLCYIKAWPTYVTLGFYQQGIHLDDPEGRLEGTGENMRHVKVRESGNIDQAQFTEWVKKAVAINGERAKLRA